MTGSLPEFSVAARAAMSRALEVFRVSDRSSYVQWAEQYRHIATGATPGKFTWDPAPFWKAVLEAADDPAVTEICCQKSSQIGWTVSVVLNIMGRHIHVDPAQMIAVFAKDGAAKKFVIEKLNPTIKATPALAERVDLRPNNPNSTMDFKAFMGGFLKLVGANSPSNVKSTDARIGMVEEPDDVSQDVKGQGDAIAHVKERTKSFPDALVVVGGTPTLKGVSNIEQEMKLSDQRRFFVCCPHCGHAQTLRWEQVTWAKDALTSHETYGTDQPETAAYLCEADGCGALWTDYERHMAIDRAASGKGGGWRATAPFTGIAGFYVSELMSKGENSKLENLVKKFLLAERQSAHGDYGELIAFYNNTLGECYTLQGDTPEVEELSGRALDYAEFTVPGPALIAVAGVDVQFDRLAVCIWCLGRGEEAWLAYWGELPGNTLERAVWDDLDKLLATPIRNAAGGVLHVRMSSVDSSDGQTSDAVYKYVRTRTDRAMAIKGSSIASREIYSPPQRSVDVRAGGKAAKYGVQPFIVGVHKAKDLIYGRLRLEGEGEARVHWYRDVREDFLAQLTSEVKMPVKGRREQYQRRAGVRNEALDATVYAFHAARRLRVPQMTDRDWQRVEAEVRQIDLLADAMPTPTAATQKTPPKIIPVPTNGQQQIGQRRARLRALAAGLNTSQRNAT